MMNSRLRKTAFSRFDGKRVYRTISLIRVRSGEKTHPISIRLLGYAHRDTILAPSPRGVEKLVREELAKEQGFLFHENTPHLTRPHSIPIDESHTKKVLVRSFLTKFNYQKLLARTILGSWKRFVVGFFVRPSIENDSPGRFKISGPSIEPSLKYLMALRKKHRVSVEDVDAGFRLLVTGRSALFASRIFDELSLHSYRGHRTASVSLGGGHLEEVRHFLEKPHAGARYCSLVVRRLRAFRADPRSYEIISHYDLDKVIMDFEHAKKLFQAQAER